MRQIPNSLPDGGPEEQYARRFRRLLQRVKPVKLERGVEILLRKARTLQEAEDLSQNEAFRRVYSQARKRVLAMLERAQSCKVRSRARKTSAP